MFSDDFGFSIEFQSNLRAALWRWRNNGSIWTLLESAFTSHFLRMVSWVIGTSFLCVSTFVRNLLTR